MLNVRDHKKMCVVCFEKPAIKNWHECPKCKKEREETENTNNGIDK
jgi:rRNA maturation endonuclease Nob1